MPKNNVSDLIAAATITGNASKDEKDRILSNFTKTRTLELEESWVFDSPKVREIRLLAGEAKNAG
jgi:hypothetical protein